jgi:hypothetical protein
MYCGLEAFLLELADAGIRPGVSRNSFCSRPQRPIGVSSSSVKAARRRSVTAGRAVVAFGIDGMK